MDEQQRKRLAYLDAQIVDAEQHARTQAILAHTEISMLCLLANRPLLAQRFIDEGISPKAVLEKLLAMRDGPRTFSR